MDHDLAVAQLSSTFLNTLSFFETPEFQKIKHDVTSFTHMVTSLDRDVTANLSSIPIHPYERLKYDYFGPDYTYNKTIDDIEDPGDFYREKSLEFLKNKRKELLSTSFHNLTCCEEDRIYTAFTITSGEQILPDRARQRSYIEFLELARSIPIDSITDENCMVIGRKLLAEFVKTI
jgi:hypothetical protein